MVLFCCGKGGKEKERKKRNEVREKKEVVSQVAANSRNPFCYVCEANSVA